MSKKKSDTPATREKELENQIIQTARLRGVYCQKIHSGAVFVKAGPLTYKMKLADKGTPDIMGCFYGRFLGIEVKCSEEEKGRWEREWQRYLATGTDDKTRTMKPAWERSVVQHMAHQAIRKAGGEVLIVCSPEDLLADLAFLQEEYTRAQDLPDETRAAFAGEFDGGAQSRSIS